MPDANRTLVAEVNNNFLYLDEIEQVIPENSLPADSTDIANKYIRKWATDILIYEKAMQNISDMSEIDRLVNEYKKSLIIHQYQQKLVEKSRKKKTTEEETLAFYEEYKGQMILKENIIRGLLLVVPEDAPNIRKVYDWVKKADQESIESIDKYSLQNAISYDYFMDTWIPLAEVTRKTPFNFTNPAEVLSSNKTIETSDSTHHYFLRIDSYAIVGQTEPYEIAKEKIKNIISTKNNSEYISKTEYDLYNDAVAKKKIKLYQNKPDIQ